MLKQLEINKELKDLIPPLTTDEYEGLERSIISEGCRESIIVWNNTIVDGHNRYEICQKHSMDFSVAEKSFDDIDDAKLWIINNQFSRRNISNYDRSVLALKKKDIIASQAKENQGMRIDIRPTLARSSIITREEVAKEAGISHGTISKVELIERKAPEEIKEKIRRNELSINKVYKDIKNEEYKEKEAELKDISHIEIPDVSDRYKLYNCDILSAPIEDNSIDVIITDPPYPKEYLDCWTKLAQFAAAKLKDGGVLVAMSGQSYLPEVYKNMTIEGLNYYWTCCIHTPGMSANMRQKRLNSNWKPLLFYVKGDYTRTFLNTDIFVSEYKDTNSSQTYHKWGQSYPLTKSIVEKFTYTSDIICDPFAGGGTTLLAGLELKRKVIGVEIENSNYKIVLDRIGGV